MNTETNNSINELKIAAEGMAETLSAIHSGITTSVDAFKNMFISTAQKAGTALSFVGKEIPKEDMVKLNKYQEQFIKLLETTPYSEVREVRAYKPEGLKVTFLEFLDALDPEIDYVKKLETDVLHPYASFLAQIVSDNKVITSTNTNDIYYNKMQERRDKAYTVLSNCYQANSVAGTAIVKSVVDRNSDWNTLFIRANSSIERISSINRESMKKSLKQSQDYLDIIIEKIESGKLDNISPETTKQLANGAWQIGKEVEFFSTTYFRLLTLRGSIENTVNKITEVFTK